uniref:[F-actin]-monooxygenase MICAL1-3-like Rossman domain-containing protein n=1 Tax=Ditylenchus dipsaci TaxID=166011 RepID=A0A915DR86_9BILA
MHPSTIFENSFAQASTFRTIQQTFFQLCTSLDISPSNTSEVYEKLSLLDRGKDHSKANKLWTLLEKRRNQTEYCSQQASIEYALLGAHVIVVEQRDKFSRNNVLHLWDFVIHDLKALGAKIFYLNFALAVLIILFFEKCLKHSNLVCLASEVSFFLGIRRLQCILLKIALVLGVNVHENISFLGLNEPSVDEPSTSADGKRNTLPGFARKIVRGKLAIGITANFINNKTSAEEKVAEISGVAYIFNQSFFKELLKETGIALENVVYYKNDTHYFVMCAQKQSLLQKGVIKKDFDDIPTLLSKENVDQEMLCKFAAQAADFATNGKLPQLVFAQNSRAQPDCAMFDFTALSSALYSTRLVERNSKHLIMSIVGDSLHEPFWPTGSGIARGFLSVFDSAWIKENVYKLLAQTTKENMCKIISKYTIDPKTRYKQIDHSVDPDDVVEQVDTDNPRMRPTCKPLPLRIDCTNQNGESPEHLSPEFARKYELWMFCHRILLPFRLKVVNFKAQSWGDARPLAALVGKFRPSLIDYIALCAENNLKRCWKKF